MSKLSNYFKDQLKSSCVGCTRAKDEIKILLNHVTDNFLENPSKFLGFELQESKPYNTLEVFNHWAQNFDRDSVYLKCPHLKERIKHLVYKLLNKKANVVNTLKRKFDDGLIEMLESLKCVAVDVYDDRIEVHPEWKNMVFKARIALYLRLAEASNMEEFPFRKTKRTRKSLSATNNVVVNNVVVNNVRRSQRKPLQIGNREDRRDHISVGPTFQADLPNWTGQPLEEDVSEDSKWLGTQIWPVEGKERRSTFKVIGKGRRSSSCKCKLRGSVKCITYHVAKERLHLKSYSGSSFDDLGFADMGEEISKLWTQEEQMQFDDIVKQNPLSEGKTYLGPALECFSSKSRKDIVSFYYNVFLLRRMSIQTRQGKTTVDCSDDEAVIFV